MTNTTINPSPKQADAPSSREPEPQVQAGTAGSAGWHIKMFQFLARSIFQLVFRVRVVGKRHMPRTPVVLCANHLGWADPFIVLLFLPAEPRVYIIGERQVAHISGFRNRMINWLQIMVPLDRNKPLEALHVMEDVIKRGGSILIFPEGQLGKQEGVLLPLQHGAAHLSQTLGVPVVPIGLTGTSELWLRRTITMRIGKPIPPAEYEGTRQERVRAMTARLEHDMRALLPGERQHATIKPLRKWLTELF